MARVTDSNRCRSDDTSSHGHTTDRRRANRSFSQAFTSTPASIARVRAALAGYATAAGAADLLHDHVARSAFHDSLDRGNLMAGHEHELRRTGANMLVLRKRELDQRVAAQAPAFAAERGRPAAIRRPLSGFDPLVDLS